MDGELVSLPPCGYHTHLAPKLHIERRRDNRVQVYLYSIKEARPPVKVYMVGLFQPAHPTVVATIQKCDAYRGVILPARP